jgi:hypothetical protein
MLRAPRDWIAIVRFLRIIPRIQIAAIPHQSAPPAL